MSDWISVGSYCRTCGHSKADHEYSVDGCAVGWDDDPDEAEACRCETWVYGGEDVIRRGDLRGDAKDGEAG